MQFLSYSEALGKPLSARICICDLKHFNSVFGAWFINEYLSEEVMQIYFSHLL